LNWLVDANVLSEPTRAEPDPRVVDWLRLNERLLCIDAVVLGEIRFGILLLPAGRRRARLETWFAAGVSRMTCLPWSAETGLRWAELLADLRRSGNAMPVKDSFIAATCLTHGLGIATRNVKDFASAGLTVVNPFA